MEPWLQSGNVGEAGGHRVTPRHLLDLVPGLVAYFGHDLRYRYANATYARWRGLAPETIIGRYVREVVGERNYPRIADHLRRALAGETISYEYHIFEHQHRRRVQGNYVPDIDGEGRVIGVLALVTDISARDDLQLRIAQSEAMFNEAFENAPIGKAMVDVDGSVVRANRVMADMLGRPAEDMAGLKLVDVTHPDDVGTDVALFAEMLTGQRDGYCLEMRFLRPDGTSVHARLAVSAVRDDSGKVVRSFVHLEDVTQQREAERRLIETNARLSLVTEAVRGGSWHMDVASGRFQTSEALAQLVAGPGTASLDLSGFSARIHPDDLAGADLKPLIEGRFDRNSVEYRLETHTGTHWMRCDRRLLRDDQGRPEQIVGVTIDLTDEHQRRMVAETQASTDPLTGLLNRRGFEQRLRNLPADCACGLMLVDLDGFKQVNDQLGHDAGDEILVEAAGRLRGAVRDTDLVARFGGDEFAVVLVGADVAALQRLADRVIVSLHQDYGACAGTSLGVGASLGAIWSPTPPVAAPAVMARADRALYEAKGAGRGTWRLAA